MPNDQPLYALPDLFDRMRTPKGDLAHYQRLALQAGGPMLELGCGSGRLTLRIAAIGVPITGIDLAPEMIAAARVKAAACGAGDNPRWLVGNMADFRLDARFALVAITFNALQHLLDNDSVKACFNRAKAHLEPGGLLAFDVLNPAPIVLAGSDEPYPVDHLKDRATGHRTTVLENVRYDRVRQVVAIDLTFVETDALAQEISRREMTQTLRIFYPLEMGELLGQCGFRVIERWGDFDGSPFGPASNRQIYLAEPV